MAPHRQTEPSGGGRDAQACANGRGRGDRAAAKPTASIQSDKMRGQNLITAQQQPSLASCRSRRA
jgi:hypothetical protein